MCPSTGSRLAFAFAQVVAAPAAEARCFCSAVGLFSSRTDSYCYCHAGCCAACAAAELLPLLPPLLLLKACCRCCRAAIAVVALLLLLLLMLSCVRAHVKRCCHKQYWGLQSVCAMQLQR